MEGWFWGRRGIKISDHKIRTRKDAPRLATPDLRLDLHCFTEAHRAKVEMD